MYEESCAYTSVQLNLVRIIRNGKADDYCEIVEYYGMDGSTHYYDTNAFEKTTWFVNKYDYTFWIGKYIHWIYMTEECFIKNKDILVPIIRGQGIDLSKTVQFEQSSLRHKKTESLKALAMV